MHLSSVPWHRNYIPLWDNTYTHKSTHWEQVGSFQALAWIICKLQPSFIFASTRPTPLIVLIYSFIQIKNDTLRQSKLQKTLKDLRGKGPKQEFIKNNNILLVLNTTHSKDSFCLSHLCLFKSMSFFQTAFLLICLTVHFIVKHCLISTSTEKPWNEIYFVFNYNHVNILWNYFVTSNQI